MSKVNERYYKSNACDLFTCVGIDFQAIRASNCLKVLVLQNNSIRVTGLTAIGRALEKNNTLQKIFLWGNVFDDSAGRLYHELGANRFPYTGLRLDFTTYVVDGVHHVAELSE